MITELTPEQVEIVEKFAEEWLAEGPVDWDHYDAKLEEYLGDELPDQWLHPVWRKIKRIVAKVRKDLRDS